MGSRGYTFDTVDGRHFAVPSFGELMCPLRGEETNFPSWFVEFTRDGVYNMNRFGEDTAYTLEKLGDGTLEFRDVDIDTLMYTMTPVYTSDGSFDHYDIDWEEYTTDDRPSTCGVEGGVVLPADEDGETWGVFSPSFDHVAFPVYSLVDDMMEITEGAGEEAIIRYSLKYYLDLCYEAGFGCSCALWDYEDESLVAEFSLGVGEYDTQHRRVYPLDGISWSVLFGDDGFVLYDDAGNTFGSAVRYEHEDDEGFGDGWGMDSLSGLALEDYLERFSGDDRRGRSEELRTSEWNSTLEENANPLDKVAMVIRMYLDAALEEESETWPVEIPPNHYREIEGTGYRMYSTKAGWEVRDENGEVVYTVTRTGGSSDAVWNFYSPSEGTKYLLEFVGSGAYQVASNSGAVLYTIEPKDGDKYLEPNGEYSFDNLYPALAVVDQSGDVAYVIGKPIKADDPFDSLTFMEFSDYVPLRKVDGAWITYAGDPKYYASQSDNVAYWQDIYDRHNVLSYRIAKPGEWDEDDREIYSVDKTKVATLTVLSLVSDKTGETIAKCYEDPEALYTYQMFDNGTGAYNYLTRYSNDMVVVVNAKGNVVRYVMPNLELRGPTWYLFGTVERRRVVDTEGNVLYTFISDDGDWNIYDPDGNLAAHLYSSSTPNNEWTIAEGCQRMLTFLATESKVVVDSDGRYTFTSKDGETTITSRVEVQTNEAGVLQLRILDEDGEETYRITPSGSSYQINYINGVAFDTAVAYETYSQGNMVLTRYWSTPYNRMMYSCTNDQVEGTFDDDGSDGDDVPSPLASGGNVGRGSVRGVSYTSAGVLSDADRPRTLAATATSEGTSDSAESAMSSPDTIQDLMDSMSDFYDSVNGVLSKDTNTSKAQDLDPDNPLQISHTETDGRQIANAVFTSSSGTNVVETQALEDAYDYTQAITRLSKMYSLGRADIYKEAQDYAETRTKRIEAKKAAFINVMTKSKEIAEKMKN